MRFLFIHPQYEFICIIVKKFSCRFFLHRVHNLVLFLIYMYIIVSDFFSFFIVLKYLYAKLYNLNFVVGLKNTLCPRSFDPLYIITYFIKWVNTRWYFLGFCSYLASLIIFALVIENVFFSFLFSSVDFALVTQIFYPFSLQTHPSSFPGTPCIQS